MKKWMMAIVAISLMAALSTSVFAHHGYGRTARTYTATTQCADSSVCMVDGVCDGSCLGAGDCAYYDGCNSACNGSQTCTDNGYCGGGHHQANSGTGYGYHRRGCHS